MQRHRSKTKLSMRHTQAHNILFSALLYSTIIPYYIIHNII